MDFRLLRLKKVYFEKSIFLCFDVTCSPILGGVTRLTKSFKWSSYDIGIFFLGSTVNFRYFYWSSYLCQYSSLDYKTRLLSIVFLPRLFTSDMISNWNTIQISCSPTNIKRNCSKSRKTRKYFTLQKDDRFRSLSKNVPPFFRWISENVYALAVVHSYSNIL